MYSNKQGRPFKNNNIWFGLGAELHITRQALEGRGMEYLIINNENLGYFGQILDMKGLVSWAKQAYQLTRWVG